MADINRPVVGDLAAMNEALAQLEARMKAVQADVTGTFQQLNVEITAANTANERRAPVQLKITETVASELTARREITAELVKQNAILGRAGFRNALQQMQVNAAGQGSEPAPSGGGGGTRGGGGGGTSLVEAAPQPMISTRRLQYEYAGLGVQYNASRAALSSLNTEMTRHGWLTSEAITAAAKGELTYREWATQIAGTAAKFGAWTAVSIPIFGAIGAMKTMYDGAVQASQGVAFMQRSIDNVNTGQARSQLEALSEHFNVPIKDAANAVGIMGRIYHNQGQAVQAALPVLYAEKLEGLDPTTYGPQLAGISRAFNLPSSDLQGLFGMITQARLRYGASIANTTQGLATAGGAWAAQGGGVVQLLSYLTAVSRLGGNTASFSTAVTQIARQVQQPQQQSALRALGIDPTQSLSKILNQAFAVAKEHPEDANSIAAALGNARIFRTLPALFRNPKLVDQIQSTFNQVGSISGYGGPQENELQRQLHGAGEQIHALSNEMNRLGASLGTSGALAAFSEMLRFTNDLLNDANHIVEAFGKLPGPVKEAVSLGAELLLITKAASALSLGKIIPPNGPGQTRTGARGFLYDMLTPGVMATQAKEYRTFAEDAVLARKDSYTSFEASAASQDAAAQAKSLQLQEAQATGAATEVQQALQAQYVALRDGANEASALAAIYKQMWAEAAVVSAEIRELGANDAAVVAVGKARFPAGVPVLPRGQGEVRRGAASETVVKEDIVGVGGVPVAKAKAPGALAVGAAVGSPEAAATGAGAGEVAAGNALTRGLSSFGSVINTTASKVAGAGFTYLIGSAVAQIAGQTIGGKIGSTIGSIGSDAAIGAAVGSVIPVVGTGVGALIGAGVGGLVDAGKAIFGGGNSASSATITQKAATDVNVARQMLQHPDFFTDDQLGVARVTVWRHGANAIDQKFQSSITDPILRRMQNAPNDAARGRIEAQAVQQLETLATTQGTQPGFFGNEIVALNAIRGAVHPNVGFMQFYQSLTGKGQGNYDSFIKDSVQQQGLGALAPGGRETLFSQGLSAAKYEMDQSRSQLAASLKVGISPTKREALVESADAYANRAAQLTKTFLDQANTDLSDSLAEATNPQQIQAAYATASRELDRLKGLTPQQRAAAKATNAYNEVSGFTIPYAQNQTAIANAQDTNPVDVAQRNVALAYQTLKDLRGIKGQSAILARQQAQAQIAAGPENILQANEGLAQSQAQLAAAQAGNNQPAADAAIVSGYQTQIGLLASSGLSAKAKAYEMVGLRASLTSAQLTLYNDTADWTRNLIQATDALAGDTNNNPISIATAAVKAAADTLAYGHFKTPAERVNAEHTLREARFSAQSTDFSQLQVKLDLSHASVGQQIVAYTAFIKKLGNKNIALKQQVEEALLQAELQSSGSYELNVGDNLPFPSAYQARRAEGRLHAPHDQQEIADRRRAEARRHAEQDTHHQQHTYRATQPRDRTVYSQQDLKVGQVNVYIHGGHDAKNIGDRVVLAFSQHVRGAARAGMRSDVLR